MIPPTTSKNASNSLRRDGRVVSCQPPAISSSSANANANAKIRLSHPAGLLPGTSPSRQQLPMPTLQAQCERGAICLALALIPGPYAVLNWGNPPRTLGPTTKVATQTPDTASASAQVLIIIAVPSLVYSDHNPRALAQLTRCIAARYPRRTDSEPSLGERSGESR